jgi:hypothetical protein
MARGARRRPQPPVERLQLRLAEFRLGVRLAREDLHVLGDRIDDSPPWLDGDASSEWKAAADLHAAGRAALREVASLADVLAVHTTLREAWFHLARAEALALDEEPPASSTPCFFSPQHGPADTEVAWAPLGQEPRPVPVCGEDAERIANGFAPHLGRLRVTTFTDQADNSAIQRAMEQHARGGGGYAQGALNAGGPHPMLI